MADSKITGLVELTTPETGDIFAIVDSPGVTPVTKKITIDNLDLNLMDNTNSNFADKTAAETITGAYTFNGAVVINEAGADIDTRIESDNLANALFIQGSDGYVGIGTASPLNPLYVWGVSASTVPTIHTYVAGHSAEINTYSANAGFDVIAYQGVSGSPYTKYSDLISNSDGTAPSIMRFFTKTNGDASPSLALTLDSSQNATFAGAITAASYTDNTPAYEGNALEDINKIKTINGEIDHDTLPVFAQKEIKKSIYENKKDKSGKEIKDEKGKIEKEYVGVEVTKGRDLGAMISILTKAVQELSAEVELLKK